MAENADVIFVGNKPPMSYVLAIITSLSSGKINEITLKARGQAITTAVDVAEITRNRFIKELQVAAKSLLEPPRCHHAKERTRANGFDDGNNPDKASLSKKSYQCGTSN